MTRDDIYEHLAQVYLGKKKKSIQQKEQHFSAWLVINIVITFVIFASSFYGFTAFLARRGNALHNKVIYALNNGPIRVNYNVRYPHPSVKSFSLSVPKVGADKYKQLQFSARGMEEGYPGRMRIELKNKKNERDSVFVDDIQLDWKRVSIPLEKFEKISDWSDIDEVSFVLESWNVEKQKGILLIDNICFSG